MLLFFISIYRFPPSFSGLRRQGEAPTQSRRWTRRRPCSSSLSLSTSALVSSPRPYLIFILSTMNHLSRERFFIATFLQSSEVEHCGLEISRALQSSFPPSPSPNTHPSPLFFSRTHLLFNTFSLLPGCSPLPSPSLGSRPPTQIGLLPFARRSLPRTARTPIPTRRSALACRERDRML